MIVLKLFAALFVILLFLSLIVGSLFYILKCKPTILDCSRILSISLLALIPFVLSAKSGFLGDRMQYEFGSSSSKEYSEKMNKEMSDLFLNHTFSIKGNVFHFDDGTEVSVYERHFTTSIYRFQNSYGSFKYKPSYEVTYWFVNLIRQKEKDSYE